MASLEGGLRERLTALMLYGGAASAYALYRPTANSGFLGHHLRHALALWFVFGLVSLFFVSMVLILSFALVFARSPYEDWRLEFYLLGFTRKLYVSWAVCWAYAAAVALCGAMWRLPLFTRLAERRFIQRFTALAMLIGFLLLSAAIPFVVHGERLVRSDAAPGSVYLLYEDMDFFPRWIFTFGFYPIALETERRIGPGAVVALPLSEASIYRAVREGEFIFIGSHGTERGLMLKGSWFRPEDLPRGAVHEGLRYVYITGCDSGVQRASWEEALAPAEVVTFDRLSAVIEHAWWLWMEGPGVIHRLYDPRKQETHDGG